MVHCVVRGSINLDEYYYVNHISRPGETISSRDFQQRMGGKGFNQAVAVSLATGGGAEGRVSFYGTVGDDEAGKGLREKLFDRWGLKNETLFVDSAKATGRAIIQVAEDGENSIVLFPGANHSELIERQGIVWPVETTHVLLQNEISLKSTLKTLEIADGFTTIFNPSPMLSVEEIRHFPWDKVDWLIINRLEAQSLLNALDPNNSLKDDKEILVALAHDARLVQTGIVCTLGAGGVLALVPRLPIVFVAAAPLEKAVADTTGAGDTFTGYFVAGLMTLGWQVTEETEVVRLLQLATRAAAMCVERAGTVDSMPAIGEVDRRFAVVRA